MDPSLPSLRTDPSLALPKIDVPRFQPKAFYPKLEFVVEIVGPRTVPANQALAALRPDWQAALASPKVVCMAPSDTEWQILTNGTRAQAFDSLAFCWPFLSPKGQLTRRSAAHLLAVSESFAGQIQRRAIPHMPVEGVESRAADLRALSDQLDYGVGLTLAAPTGGVSEMRIWETAASLGLHLSSEGEFVFRAEGLEEPLFALSTLGPPVAFSLEGAKAEILHEALSVGTRIPTNPAPEPSYEAMSRAAQVFASRLGLEIADDDGNRLTQEGLEQLGRSVWQAAETLRQAGIVPGSPESRLIFV